MTLIRTKEKDFSRDTNSRALLNTNRSALEDNLNRRKMVIEIDQLREDFKDLNSDMAEIKGLLKDLIDR